MSENGYSVSVDPEFLAHHGVKGMQWGVWNDETKRKYGMATASTGGGGGGSVDTDELKRGMNPDDLIVGGIRGVVEGINVVGKGISEGVEDIINTHLGDIQTGNIARGEAQVISAVNAAVYGATGEGAIKNPLGNTAYDNKAVGTKTFKDGQFRTYKYEDDEKKEKDD